MGRPFQTVASPNTTNEQGSASRHRKTRTLRCAFKNQSDIGSPHGGCAIEKNIHLLNIPESSLCKHCNGTYLGGLCRQKPSVDRGRAGRVHCNYQYGYPSHGFIPCMNAWGAMNKSLKASKDLQPNPGHTMENQQNMHVVQMSKSAQSNMTRHPCFSFQNTNYYEFGSSKFDGPLQMLRLIPGTFLGNLSWKPRHDSQQPIRITHTCLSCLANCLESSNQA